MFLISRARAFFLSINHILNIVTALFPIHDNGLVTVIFCNPVDGGDINCTLYLLVLLHSCVYLLAMG